MIPLGLLLTSDGNSGKKWPANATQHNQKCSVQCGVPWRGTNFAKHNKKAKATIQKTFYVLVWSSPLLFVFFFLAAHEGRREVCQPQCSTLWAKLCMQVLSYHRRRPLLCRMWCLVKIAVSLAWLGAAHGFAMIVARGPGEGGMSRREAVIAAASTTLASGSWNHEKNLSTHVYATEAHPRHATSSTY